MPPLTPYLTPHIPRYRPPHEHRVVERRARPVERAGRLPAGRRPRRADGAERQRGRLADRARARPGRAPPRPHVLRPAQPAVLRRGARLSSVSDGGAASKKWSLNLFLLQKVKVQD